MAQEKAAGALKIVSEFSCPSNNNEHLNQKSEEVEL